MKLSLHDFSIVSATAPFFRTFSRTYLHRLHHRLVCKKPRSFPPLPRNLSALLRIVPRHRRAGKPSPDPPGIFHKNYEHFVNKADFCRMILYNVSIRQGLLPLFFRTVHVGRIFPLYNSISGFSSAFAGIRAVSGRAAAAAVSPY